jgi:hypothetical protein
MLIDANGQKVDWLELLVGAAEALDPPPTPGTTINRLAADIVFNMTTGLQRFVVPVPGVTANCWTSLGGEPATPGERVGVQGCFMSNVDEVTLLADYESLSPVTSLTVPIVVFWY